MMSEHLAGMNEKLTMQKDEIDLLKFQLQQQNSKVVEGIVEEIKSSSTPKVANGPSFFLLMALYVCDDKIL